MISTFGRQLSGTMLGLLLASSAAAQTFCPGSSYLATSCRDGVCRTDAGENALNCPEDCADKSTQVLSYYAQGTACPPSTIHEPVSVSELQDTIRTIVSSGSKVKPAGTSHSATDMICADNNGEIVRSKNLTNIGPVEPFEAYPMTVEVESGVKFQHLQEYLAERGLISRYCRYRIWRYFNRRCHSNRCTRFIPEELVHHFILCDRSGCSWP